jgi:uncharacterized coiled-coil protein SlyX
MQPRPSSRIKSLETRATTIEAAVEELSSDQAEGLKDLKQDIKELDDSVKASYKTIGDTFMAVEANIGARLDRIESTMATKEDISRLETDIASIRTTQDEQSQMLKQILNRLPPIGE